MYHDGQQPELGEPTYAAPGSRRKIEIMRSRVQYGLAPCHPRDARIVYPLPGGGWRNRVVAMEDVWAAIDDTELDKEDW